MFRTIIEETPHMRNNNEFVFYSEKQITDKDTDKMNVKLVFSRPVYPFEENLIKKQTVHKFNEKISEETKIMDSFYRCKEFLIKRANLFEIEMSRAVIHEIANDFYDCLSGGCGKYMLSIYCYLLNQFNVDDNELIYPPDHKVIDFKKECENLEIPNFEEVMKKYQIQLDTVKMLGGK